MADEGPWWFTVKYGEDQQALFNMDCWSCTLINHIKDKCGYEKIPEKLDLCKEGGSMIDMPNQGRTPGKDALEPKATYILYKLVVAEEGAPPTPEMLWTPPEGYAVPAPAAGGKADPKKK